MNLSETLQLFLDKKASDLHLSTDNPIMMRVDGELEVVGDYIIQESDCLQIFNDEEIAAIQGIDPITFNKERDLDFAVNKVGSDSVLMPFTKMASQQWCFVPFHLKYFHLMI